ncbi:hypothetical protein BsWGS_20110 [Bradybaena similaris]
MSLPAGRLCRGTVHLTQYEAKNITMETRALTKPDYMSNRTYKVPRKVISLSLGDLHQTYLPAQPVLSSRTVDIDLPGTRTYRQKSTLDILEEQQRLIRQLYLKPRAPVSAPPRARTPQTTRSLPESNIGKVNIEVKGRPLTSGPTVSSTYKENTPVVPPRRPKTAGPLKQVCPLTNCHRATTEDRDLLAISHSSQKLSNKIHSYWNSDVNTLAVGKFVKGQKFLDEALPNLDSWLTFGGAAGINSQGVIDAFARFNSSEEYYNIKGSVGSQVAQQLQKGGKIRIGINGTLQTQGLKVKKWNNKNMTKLEAAGMSRDSQHNTTNTGKVESLLAATESATNAAVKEIEAAHEQVLADQETEAAVLVNEVLAEGRTSEIDFGELVIPELDDFQEKPVGAEMQKTSTPECVEESVDTASEASVPNEEVVSESLRLATPLSWTDQCSKANVKIIHANLCQRPISKPVMSETFAVKFHKLTEGVIRPKLMEVKSEGFKMKQRSPNESRNNRDNVSKVKVVYIDPLTTEEDEMVKGLSVDTIINHKLEGRSSANSSILLAHGMGDHEKKNASTNTEGNKATLPHRGSFTQSESRSHLSTSSNSGHRDRSSIYSPKLKVTPVHSAAGHKVGNLRVMSAGASHSSKSKDLPRNGRTPRKLTPARPLHLTSAGQGSSIKAGPLKGETEYITIISQLKIPSPGAPAVSQMDHVAIGNLEQHSAGRNSPADLNKITKDNEAQPESEQSEGGTEGLDVTHGNHTSSTKSIPVPTDYTNENDFDLENKENNSDAEFPAAATSPSGRPIATASETSATNFPAITAAASSPAMKPMITAITTPPATVSTTTAAATSSATFQTTTAAATSLATFPSAAISIPTAEEEASSHLLPQHRAIDTPSDQNH